MLKHKNQSKALVLLYNFDYDHNCMEWNWVEWNYMD